MASAATISPSEAEPPKVHASDIPSIKAFAESSVASLIPSTFHSIIDPHDDVAKELEAFIPVIDLSLLTSHDPEIHAKAVHQLGKACEEWSFFILINHGIPEKMMEEVMNKSIEFHDLPVEEKEEFRDKGPLAAIRHGTSFWPQSEKVHFWRDYLKVFTHPEFNFPHKPPGYREIVFDYGQKIRAVAWKLLEGISESLGLESNSLIESTGFESGIQICAVNMYPACPQPHLSLGMPSHSDIGLMNFLMENGIGGLQIKHDGKWVNVNPPPNSLAVILGDQLEIVTNGKYPSVIHRAILNNTNNRVSVVLANGPALEKEIGPPRKLLEKEKPLFKSITFKDYFQFQQKSRLSDKYALDVIGLNT
ncbi:flavanone 3-dioxygenase 2-like [Abrus precatorius]|uniref:Flavanone 3-dioxygenase 2-like n=1 Tax=Abrus precatorius TaxID=3816 RepID=A0A8B8MBU0_ABRPR|nr:flavanone 3-dioxygenase 2-like [Abrus precatorius]